jgi:uncharacterized protein (TIGR03118 family)
MQNANLRTALCLFTVAALGTTAPAATSVVQTNLVTDDQAVNAAQITDANLLNPWGVSYLPGGPFWVSDNGAGVSTLYNVDPASHATSQLGLIVTIPVIGAVTGQVSTSGAASGAFDSTNFLFVSEDGTISGWKPALGTNAETLQTANPANIYKGSALVTTGGHSYLLATNFGTGNVDVLKGDLNAPDLTGKFLDPNLPSGYAPFNIALLNNRLYVTYALKNGVDDVPGAGHGFVNAFDLQGNLTGRIATMGALNSPWGLAIAPANFGDVAGNLLIGNFGDGTINVYNPDPTTPGFVSTLNDPNNQPLVIPGLWALIPGNNGSAGSSAEIFFTAGPNDESNGLMGVIAAVPEPATLSLAGLAAGALFPRRRR